VLKKVRLFVRYVEGNMRLKKKMRIKRKDTAEGFRALED